LRGPFRLGFGLQATWLARTPDQTERVARRIGIDVLAVELEQARVEHSQKAWVGAVEHHVMQSADHRASMTDAG
jgi:hypothetical protein